MSEEILLHSVSADFFFFFNCLEGLRSDLVIGLCTQCLWTPLEQHRELGSGLKNAVKKMVFFSPPTTWKNVLLKGSVCWEGSDRSVSFKNVL